jgi:hypothetical protein
MARPKLDPPCLGWERDLPAPSQPPGMLEVLGDPPNHVDDIYLEFPRSTFWGRGFLLIAAIGVVGAGGFAISTFVSIGQPIDILLSLLVAVFTGYTCAHAYRVDVTSPLDEPIRFNRLRRKVYVYRFHYCWWRPFNNALWYVKSEVYDWDDLRAEVYQIYIPTVTYNSGVNIAVVKPGTNKVIDRFFFGHGLVPANYWKMAVAFMQSGPDVLPKFDRPPRDWNNEDPGINLTRRFAPKVKWPEAMDVESRTAP